jgi:hypothetical protein
LKLALSLFLLLAPVFSFAGGSSNGLVSSPLVEEHGILFFGAGSHPNKPACSTAGDTWAANINTVGGKAMLALVLPAHAQRKKIAVVGKGNCDVWGDKESPALIYIPD